jgi:hypothetical protein
MDSFATIVHEYFDDIAESHVMHCIDQQEFHIRYANAKVSVGVSWDRVRSYELGVGVGLESAAGDDRLSFDLWDILRFQDAAETSWVGGLSVNPSQDLSWKARFLRAFGSESNKFKCFTWCRLGIRQPSLSPQLSRTCPELQTQ